MALSLQAKRVVGFRGSPPTFARAVMHAAFATHCGLFLCVLCGCVWVCVCGGSGGSVKKGVSSSEPPWNSSTGYWIPPNPQNPLGPGGKKKKKTKNIILVALKEAAGQQANNAATRLKQHMTYHSSAR